MIGTTVGRYRIESKLGEGGMGVVWKALDPLLERVVALKFLPVSMCDSPEARQRFLREARTASSLGHHGIATVHDAGEHEGRLYMAMAFVDGETLAARLARGPMAVDEALRIAAAAGAALAHAHGRGVLHRDVSSRNIMVDREGQPIVVDFGLALPEGRTQLTDTGTFMGTVAYVAPEVLQGSQADARSDIYSLGVVLYEMLTGQLPFSGDRQEAVMYAAVHAEPTPPSQLRDGIPAVLDSLVARVLSKDPESRHQTAAELVADLHALGAEAGPLASPTPGAPVVPAPRSASFPARAIRRSLPVVITIGILAVAGALYLAWRESVRTVPAAELPRVAVLPLEDLSPDPSASRHIGAGIGATLASKLAQVLGTQVIPWSTSQRFGGRELVEVARELRVDALITGSYQNFGGHVAVSISLVDPQAGVQSWASDFEAPATDIMQLQARIALRAAAALKGKLSGSEREVLKKQDTQSATAYDYYLRGKEHMLEETKASFATALEYLEKAVELDPEFAQAHVGIGAVYRTRDWYGWGGVDNRQKAEASFRLANRLDPGLYAAHSGLLRIYFDRGMSEESLRLGQEIERKGSTSAEAVFTRAEAYLYGGLPEDAIGLFERVVELDPANQGARWYLVIAKIWAGRPQQAIEAANAYTARFGRDMLIMKMIAAAFFELKDLEQSRLYFDLLMQSAGDMLEAEVCAAAADVNAELGDLEHAQQILRVGSDLVAAQLRDSPDNSYLRSWSAVLAAQLGDRRKVLAEAEKLRTAPDQAPVNLLLSHAFAILGDFEVALDSCEQALELGIYRPPVLWFPSWWPAAEGFLPDWNVGTELRARLDRHLAAHAAEGERLRSLYAAGEPAVLP